MIKFSRIVLAILCLTIPGILSLTDSFAQPTMVSERTREEIYVKEGSGEVISVDAAAQTVVVKIFQDDTKGSSQEVVLVIDDNTMITSQDSTLSISDLKPGSKVTIVYETKGPGTNVAKSILVS